MSSMFDLCSSLGTVKLGEGFSFAGKMTSRQCYLPTPRGNRYTGLWVSSADGKAYAPGAVPDNVAATYTAQTKADIFGAVISDIPDSVYTGAAIEPAFTVTLDGKRLVEGADYMVSYSNNVDAGEATVIVRGVGGYSGEETRTFEILPAAVEPPVAVGDLSYTGEPQTSVAAAELFDVSGGTATDAGDYVASASLKDKRNYAWAGAGSSDDVQVPWSIAPAAMDRGMVSGVPAEMTATGKQLAPEPVVAFNGERLVEGRDYAVSYGDNVEPGVGAGSVTVSAVEGGNFAGSVTVYFDIETKIVFPDVDYDNDWFAPAVTFVSSRGLITGYADSSEFGPLDTLTRGQLATILWRNACPDEAASYDASEAVNETGLSGVDDHEYYTAAANWAVREGIITGFEREDGTYDFAASSPVSFEQLITILSRLGATSDEVAAAGDDLSEFLDGDNASPWSRSPIAWAAEKGLVGGYENEDGTRTLAPGEDVSRGRAATVLMRAFDLGIMG